MCIVHDYAAIGSVPRLRVWVSRGWRSEHSGRTACMDFISELARSVWTSSGQRTTPRVTPQLSARAAVIRAKATSAWIADGLEKRPGYERLQELIDYATNRLHTGHGPH